MLKLLQRDKSKRIQNSHCLKPSIAIMKYSGVWIPDDIKQPWLFKLFGFSLQTVVFFLIIAAEVFYVFKVLGDTERAIDAAVLLISHIVQAIKIGTIWCRQRRIKRLIRFIDGPCFQKKDPIKRAMIEDTVHLATLVGQTINMAVSVTVIFWCTVPVLKSELSLPLKTVYPFDISGTLIFGIMYAYNAVSVIIVGLGDTAENYLVSGLMVLAGAQLDVLTAELSEIGIKSKGDEDTYRDIVKCIKYHQSIIKYVKELASIFGLPIFCQCIASSVVICMTLFKITMTKEPMELITVSFYLSCVFMELLMYCYPGDLILNKSLQVAEAACPNKWAGDIRCKKALLLCTIRAQRPLMVNAGGLFRVSLPTSAGVVRTAYSYYAVLQQVVNN